MGSGAAGGASTDADRIGAAFTDVLGDGVQDFGARQAQSLIRQISSDIQDAGGTVEGTSDADLRRAARVAINNLP